MGTDPSQPQYPAQPPYGHQYPQQPAGAGQVPPGGWQQPVPYVSPWAPYLAGWWNRVGAALLDGLIIGVPAFAIYFLVFFGGIGLIAGSGSEEASAGAFAGFFIGIFVFMLVLFVVALLYSPLLMAREGERNGQTWGRQAAGTRVVRVDGQPVSFGFALLREVVVKGLLFGTLGSFFFGIPALLDVLWPLWDDENRALHDMIVNTRVIRA